MSGDVPAVGGVPVSTDSGFHRATAAGLLHMTETRYQRAWDEWLAVCRCGWVGSYLPTQERARRDGDLHLAAKNIAKEFEA